MNLSLYMLIVVKLIKKRMQLFKFFVLWPVLSYEKGPSAYILS